MNALRFTSLGIIGVCSYVFLSRKVSEIRNRLTFLPTKGLPCPQPSLSSVKCKSVFIGTEDNEILHGWYLSQDRKTKDLQDSTLLIFFHGNGGNLGGYVTHIEHLYELGFDVLAVDYRGYGMSSGDPTEQGILKDAEAIIENALNLGYSLNHIVIYGFSLGTVPATWLAHQYKVKALVIQNGFTTIWEIPFVEKFVPGYCTHLASTDFTPKDYLAEVSCPVCIIHSKDDKLCPIRMGMELYSAVPHKVKKSFITIDGTHSVFSLESANSVLQEFLS